MMNTHSNRSDQIDHIDPSACCAVGSPVGAVCCVLCAVGSPVGAVCYVLCAVCCVLCAVSCELLCAVCSAGLFLWSVVTF